MRRQDNSTSVANIVTGVADYIHLCSRQGANGVTIVWIAKDHS
jgi:hypothetical protein